MGAICFEFCADLHIWLRHPYYCLLGSEQIVCVHAVAVHVSNAKPDIIQSNGMVIHPMNAQNHALDLNSYIS